MHLSTRRVEIAGLTPYPTGDFMKQAARELTGFDGFLCGKRILLLDRDSKYTYEFREILQDSGVRCLRLPAQSPNLNAFAERFVLSIKTECLNRLILFGERSLRRAINSYMAHYHGERNHQGLGNEIIDGHPSANGGIIECHERLGGLLKYYERAA